MLYAMISKLNEKTGEKSKTGDIYQLNAINEIQREIVQSNTGTLIEIQMKDFLERIKKVFKKITQISAKTTFVISETFYALK